MICDICKKELISVYVWKKDDRTFVTCRACKKRGITCAKTKEIIKSNDLQGELTAQKQLIAEKKRFEERLKRQRDKEEKSKTLLENAVGNRSLLSGVRYL